MRFIHPIALAMLVVGCASPDSSPSTFQSNTKAIAKVMVLALVKPRHIVWDWEPMVEWDVISTENMVDWKQEATNLIVNLWEIDQSSPQRFYRIGAKWQEGYASE